MSWNDDNDRDNNGKKKKNPWDRQDEQGPPNIDEALKQMQQKLASLFGGKGGGFNGKSKNYSGKSGNFTSGFILIGVLALAGYGLAGLYKVQEANEAVVLRFGKFERTQGPGLHWLAPIIESKQVVNIREVRTSKRGGSMLTKDENIVNAEIAVQYRVGNAKDYLFNVVNPDKSLEQVADSSLRAVVGESTLDQVLTIGRSQIGRQIREQVQDILNNYKSGLVISDLAVQQTKAPEEVKAAFDDAIKAQQDEERLVNEAQAYSRRIVPIAEGRAKRVTQEAQAYKEKVILDAEGQTIKFNELLPIYRSAPQVTRDRMYYETLQKVYTITPKVVIDSNAGNNLMYLPLDKLITRSTAPMDSQKGQDSSVVSMDNPNSSVLSSYTSQLSGRPTYDEAERPSQRGE